MQVALLLGSIFLAQGITAWFRKYRGVDAGPVLWKMIVIGLLAGRGVFVLRHVDLYAAAPWSALDFRDGGFDAVAGFATAFLVGAELSQRVKGLRRPLMTAIVGGCALFFGGSAFNALGNSAGAPIPSVEMRRFDGSVAPLSAFAGRPIVVNLWASWCPPCRREMPVLQAAQLAHPEVAFLFVNQGESAAQVQAFLTSRGLAMPNVLLDPAKQFSAQTGSSGYPTTLFYDAQGRLHARQLGELSQATLADRLGQLAAPAR